MRLFYWIRAKWKAWRYKRKYGISIDEAMKQYGKFVIITEENYYEKEKNK